MSRRFVLSIQLMCVREWRTKQHISNNNIVIASTNGVRKQHSDSTSLRGTGQEQEKEEFKKAAFIFEAENVEEGEGAKLKMQVRVMM